MSIKISLIVIPEPALSTRSVLVSDVKGMVYFKGIGNVDYVCGKCGAILAKNVEMEQLNNIVLKCTICESYNEASVKKLPADMAN